MGMTWPEKYYKKIEEGKIIVPEKIKILYKREVAWIKKPAKGYSFDREEAQAHIDFIEKFCKQSRGDFGGKPLKLMLWQKAFLALLFGWKDKNGYRRFKECILIIARKNGKTELASALAHDMLLNDKENGPEIVCAANAKEQAMLTFNEAANMRTQSAALRKVEKKRRSDIYCPYNFGTIKALASKTDNLDGLNISFAIQDEIHEQKNSALYDVLRQSQTFRNQPLFLIITTNGFLREAFFDNKYEETSNIALWEDGYKDMTVLPIIYELDKAEEWTDPKMWIKANPGLGVIKKKKTLADFVKKAKRDSMFLPTVMTKDFNIPENSAEGWLTYEEATNTKVVDMEYLKNSYAIGGCDLSAVRDLTCATLLIRKPNDENVYALQKYFLPRSRLDVLSADTNSNKEAPYQLWEEKKWLKVSEGATVDFHDVTMWFVDMVRTYNIRPLWICYDAALSGYWREEMEEYGFVMEKIRQGPFTWTYPMKALKGILEEHRLIYQNNPMLRWCLLNTGQKSLNKSGIESIQPVKVSDKRRIDGMVSLLNAWTGYQGHEQEYMRYVK